MRRLILFFGLTVPFFMTLSTFAGGFALVYNGSLDGLPYTQLVDCPTDEVPIYGFGYECFWDAEKRNSEGPSFWVTSNGYKRNIDRYER